MKLILASASPRRRELFDLLKLDYMVIPSNADENIPECEPGEYVMALAKLKAESVKANHSDCCVVGCDTIVVLDSEIIGKPTSKENALEVISKLSGRTHTVYTGVCVLTDEIENVFYDCTEVTFHKLTEEEIRDYVNTGEPMDKAGAYGIQGPGSVLVDNVDGCYFTVIGLPLPKLYRALKEVGIDAIKSYPKN